MVLDQVANFVRDEVDESVDDEQTTILVADISVFPDPNDGEYNCVVWDVGEFPRPNEDPNVEIVRVTGIDDGQLVVERGVEGTSAAAHPNTSEIQLAPTAKVIQDVSVELESLEDNKADNEDVDSKADDPHGNTAHTETFAVDGDEQPPEEHDNDAHSETFVADGDDAEFNSVSTPALEAGSVSGDVVGRPEAIDNLEGNLYLEPEGTDPETVLENDGDIVFIHE